MPIVATDWTIAANGDIRYTGADHGVASNSYATVIEFHRWLQGLADDPTASGDDLLDITDTTPSDRSTDNIITLNAPYNIDDNAAQHLYDGSIIQSGGDTIYDGIVNFGNSVWINILQDGALISDDFWNETPDGQSAGTFNGDGGAISHRFMVKVRDGGSDIDGRRLLGMSREFGYTYAEFSIAGSSRGNNVLALSESSDLNNATAEGTVSGWTGITNTTEGFVQLDVTGDGSTEDYYSQWNTNQPTRSINDFYERMKWLTRRGTGSTIYGLSGDIFRGITHEIVVDGGTGTFSGPEELTWGSGATAGVGQLLAVDNNTASSATKIWIQLLSGVVPTDGVTMTGTTSSATVDMNVTITSRSISQPFIGASTGSAIIGAYGVGIETDDLTASDTLTDLDANPAVPPNQVQFSVTGLVSGEDRILVGPRSGGLLQTDQDTINGAVTGGVSTSITITGAIPGDTPASGTIRVFNGDTFVRETYTSWTGSTFTLTGTAQDSYSDSADMFISYIDELASGTSASFTGVYQSNRDLFVRCRDGAGTPIKTFESPATLGSSGGSIAVIRTSDE